MSIPACAIQSVLYTNPCFGYCGSMGRSCRRSCQTKNMQPFLKTYYCHSHTHTAHVRIFSNPPTGGHPWVLSIDRSGQYSDLESCIILNLREDNGTGFTRVEIDPVGVYSQIINESADWSFMNWESTSLREDEYFLGFYFERPLTTTFSPREDNEGYDFKLDLELAERSHVEYFVNVLKPNGGVWTPSQFYDTFSRECALHLSGGGVVQVV